MKKTAYTILLSLALSVPSPAQKTIPMNLERLVQDAGIIVHGTVVKTESGRDSRSGLIVTSVTLRVEENFYGAPASEFTFKQYGGRAGTLVYYPAGIPRFQEKEELVLMLYPASGRGLQSPVGMEQGKFSVNIDMKTGKRSVVNKFDNRNLFAGVQHPSALARKSWTKKNNPGVLDYAEFAASIRSLVQLLKP